jgi:hypothetical protein
LSRLSTISLHHEYSFIGLKKVLAFERVTQIAKDAVPEAYFYLGSLYSKTIRTKRLLMLWNIFFVLTRRQATKIN